MEKLMKLVDAEDTDYIYEVLSPKTNRNAEGLQEKITELTEFLQDQVTSWEPYTWTENIETTDGTKAKTREMFFYLHTDNGIYHCDIREVLENPDQITDVGFSSISIFTALYSGEEPPYEDDVYKGYCTWGRENVGISIVYQ